MTVVESGNDSLPFKIKNSCIVLLQRQDRFIAAYFFNLSSFIKTASTIEFNESTECMFPLINIVSTRSSPFTLFLHRQLEYFDQLYMKPHLKLRMQTMQQLPLDLHVFSLEYLD